MQHGASAAPATAARLFGDAELVQELSVLVHFSKLSILKQLFNSSFVCKQFLMDNFLCAASPWVAAESHFAS
jgi:hypothetical protein